MEMWIRMKQLTISWHLVAAGMQSVNATNSLGEFMVLLGLHIKFPEVITEQIFHSFRTAKDFSEFLILEATRNQLDTAGNMLNTNFCDYFVSYLLFSPNSTQYGYFN
jgi:hypothetical protein